MIRPHPSIRLYTRIKRVTLVASVLLVVSALPGAAQTSDRTVLGWRFGFSAGVVQVRGNFRGVSPAPSAGVNADYINRSGWGIGIGADLGLYDPRGDSFRIHTVRLSPRYASVGQGGGYYQFIGFDAVGAYYRADRSTAPVSGVATGKGLGFGPSIGAGGLVGGGGLAMELSVSYVIVGFGDATVGGGRLSGTAARAHVFRFLIGIWFG